MDDRALGDDRDAGFGDGEAALDVVLEIDTDLGTFLDDDVLIQNRLHDPRVATDAAAVHDDRILDLRPRVDVSVRGNDRAHDLAAGDDDTGRHEGVDRVAQTILVTIDELGRRKGTAS